MTDQTRIQPSTIGDDIRDIDRGGGIKTQVVQLDTGGLGATESLVSVTNPLPVGVADQLLADTWDTLVINTSDKWVVSSGGSGVPAVIVPGGSGDGGAVTLSSGTVAGGWSAMQSIPYFNPTDPGFLYSKHNNNFEFPLLTTGYRFWGLGVRQTTPTVANPLVDAMGWEITTAGALRAVCYAAGAVQPVATITVPVDANPHKYFTFFRGDLAYWCYDTVSNVVATMPTGALGPLNNVMPWLSLCVSNGGAAVTLTNNGTQVSDTAGGSISIADRDFGFRRAVVKAPGLTPLASDTALVVSLSPNSAIPLGAAKEEGGLLAELIDVERANGATLRAILLQLANLTGVDMRVEDLHDTHSLN